MNMLKFQKFKVQATRFYIFLSFIFISLFSGCSYEKLYTISYLDESEIITRLLIKNCYSSEGKEYKYTEKQLVALANDVKCILEISSCNLQNYIYKSNHKYYIIRIEDEILTEESEDFRYVYNPTDFNAIQTGEYKGYIKVPYLDISSEIDSYASVLSFYKTIFFCLNKIDDKYLSDSNKYEYLFEYYLSKI